MLRQAEAHLWAARTEALSPGSTHICRDLLSDDERIRLDRIALAQRWREYLVTRALVRVVLSCYEPVPPKAWRFKVDSHGRPSIAAPAVALALDFNLSHTHGIVLCLVAQGRRVGVDVERTDRVIDTAELGASVLTPEETADIAAKPAHLRCRRFFEYWTLKEAYVKACGPGLAIPLQSICFSLHGNLEPKMLLADQAAGRRVDWSFHSFSPTPDHTAAAAVQRHHPEETIRLVQQPQLFPP